MHYLFLRTVLTSEASVSALKESRGEVVFTTGMTGYTESITDPSYKGQILSMLIRLSELWCA